MKSLIEYYEKNLEKVRKMHSYKENDTELKKLKCDEYIAFAVKELEAVKNGREW